MSAITNLTESQVAEVTAASKRYPEQAYAEILTIARLGKPLGHVETEFPGVKPAHVVFMLKRLRGDAKDLVIDSHGEHGVCVIPTQTKPAARKPRATKPTTAKKRTTRKPA
jgi:hypothetical protein